MKARIAGYQLLMWGALALGVFFRVYNLDRKFFWNDEAHTALWLSGHHRDEMRSAFADREVAVEEVQAFQRLDPAWGGAFKTLRALAENDPQHPPLYYLLLRLWVQVVGDSVWHMRSFSVLAAILVLPCVYWLGRELFDAKDVARLATALVALSPLHVLYAQEAREYSLWILATLLSSIALWRASIAPSTTAWLLYSAAVTVGLYTHTLHLLVVLAHAVFVTASTFGHTGERPWSRALRGFLAAAAAALLAFSPWIWVIAVNLSEKNFAATSWAATTVVSPWRLLGMWGFNVASLFFDVDKSFRYVEQFDAGVLVAFAVQLAALAVSAAALYHVFREVAWRQRVFLLSLVLVPLTVLAVPDLVFGGIRSAPIRYFVPGALGVEIAVAGLLVSGLHRRDWTTPGTRRVAGVMLLAAGLVSCVISSQAETWWTKAVGYRTPQVVSVINRAERPLLIMHLSPAVLSFSHLLEEKARFYVVADPRALRIPSGYTDVFVYQPSSVLVKGLRDRGCVLESVDARGALYRVRSQTHAIHPREHAGPDS